MTNYNFDAKYDFDLQERAARIIMRRDTGQGRGLAARALGGRSGASRQAMLDNAIRFTLAAFPRVEYSSDEMEVITAALWTVNEDGFAIPPTHID